MKSDDNLRKLLELYFNGSTSSAQEEELRRRFLAGDVPEDCAGYGPLFGYIAHERADAGILVAGRTKIRSRRRIMRGIAAAVIGIAAVFAAVWVFVPADLSDGNAGYVLRQCRICTYCGGQAGGGRDSCHGDSGYWTVPPERCTDGVGPEPGSCAGEDGSV